jgi:transcriptional regulator GlxA family with amidase domain
MRIVIIAFEGAQGLDVLGPAEVFGAAARFGRRAGYTVEVASPGGGTIRATSGVAIGTRDLLRLSPRRSDTVLVAGGDEAGVRGALASRPLVRWLARAARVVRRVGSVCSGAFVLAKAGILDGRRAATHWSACRLLAERWPRVNVDADAIFVRDGRVWTSAGVTTGIDMALAMVEQDCGREQADTVAARLVVYARRPGFQAQFSEALVAQRAASGGLARALDEVRAAPARPLDVEGLARAAGMSLRTLHRRCRAELRTTPAKLLERLRAEHARLLLGTTDLGTKAIAARAGFDNPERMARAFRRTLGVTPRDYRLVFGAGAPGAARPGPPARSSAKAASRDSAASGRSGARTAARRTSLRPSSRAAAGAARR